MPVKNRRSGNQNFTPAANFTPAFFTPVGGGGRATGRQEAPPKPKAEEPKPKKEGFPLAAMQNENEGRKAFLRRIQDAGGGEAFKEPEQLTAAEVLETKAERDEASGDLGETVAPTIEPINTDINPIGNVFEGISAVTAGAGAIGTAGALAAKVGLGTAAAGGLIAGAAAVAVGGVIYLNIKANQKQITTDAYEGFTNSRHGVVAVNNQLLNAAEQGVSPATIAQRYNENLANAREIERVLTSLVNDQAIGLNYRKASDELRDVRAWLNAENERRAEFIAAINNPTGTVHPPPIIDQQVEEGGILG